MNGTHGRGRSTRWAWLAIGATLAACTCKRAQLDAPMSVREREALPGFVAFVREREGKSDLWAVTPAGRERVLSAGPANEYPGAVSPDGRHLVIIAARDDHGTHLEQLLWLPLEGGPAAPLTPPSPRARAPVFAPDGRSVISESGVSAFSDIVRHAVPPAGAEAVPIVRQQSGVFDPALSPDGSLLAYVGSDDEGDPEIFIATAEGKPVRRLTASRGEDLSPTFSPDGQWIAFLSGREGRQRAFLVRTDGTDIRPLIARGPTGDEEAVVFRPGGQEALVVERSAGGKSRLWKAFIDPKDGAPLPLGDGKNRDEAPTWSPDGKAFAFVSSRSGDLELYLARPDGTGVTQLTHSPGPDWMPRWFSASLPR